MTVAGVDGLLALDKVSPEVVDGDKQQDRADKDYGNRLGRFPGPDPQQGADGGKHKTKRTDDQDGEEKLTIG